MSGAEEVNIDALVGPSHHFGGLAFGNLASMSHAQRVSNPRAAALEGLEKAWRVARLGVPQVLLPCQRRPRLDWLLALGVSGTLTEQLNEAWRVDPVWLSAAYSASSMWVANAATVSPSADCRDRRLHLSVANLASGLHRALESSETHHLLSQWLDSAGVVHEALPACHPLRDEGAANHSRLVSRWDQPGIELFVHGDAIHGDAVHGDAVHGDALQRDAAHGKASDRSGRFPARQSLAACRAVAQRHQLPDSRVIYAQQASSAIEAGVFHNDVIAAAHRDLLWVHEHAWEEQHACLNRLQDAFKQQTGESLRIVVVDNSVLPLSEAVASYLFNSQWLSLPSGGWQILFPKQCQHSSAAQQAIAELQRQVPEIEAVHYVALDQSMANGGGPACLRLRVVMTEQERQGTSVAGWLNESRYEQLRRLIEQSYREQLTLEDLRSPDFAQESLEIWRRSHAILGFEPSSDCDHAS